MADLISMLAACAGGGEKDPDFNQTVLLLHGDGTNGAQNNTFLDSSTNNFTITRNGNTTQGTFSPFSVGAGEWSNFFDGTGDTLTAADNAAFDLGSGDWTIELWANFGSVSGEKGLVSHFATPALSTGYTLRLSTGNSPSGLRLVCSSGGGTDVILQAAWSPVVSVWYHIAAVRDGGTLRLYVDGVQIGSTSIAITIGNPSTTFAVGTAQTVASSDMNGYISNVRLVKGTCLYTGGTTFTPPTAPLTAISGTSLLTCQSNRFVDNSTNAFAITRNGDVRVTPFSPFAPTAAYSAGTNGGSGYFDGTGDYLNFTEFSSATDFTCECWFYRGPDVPTRHTLFGGNRTISNSRNCQLAVSNGGAIMVILNDAVVTNFNDVGGNVVPRDSWNHIAYVRSSTTISVFVNGTRIATGTSSATLYVTQVGAYIDALGAAVCNGYISSARVTNTAVYDPSQTTLTVPTAPLTAISGTSLLLNFTNAGIIDNTGKNNLETVGNAQIDTAVKKFGTGSLEFDGTGDGLAQYANLENYILGTGNFTIEFWINFTSLSGTPSIFDMRPVATNGAYPHMYVDTSKLRVYVNTANLISGNTTLSTGTWYHVAWVRSSGSSTLYLNGTADASSVSDTTNYLCSRFVVGIDRGLSANPLNGFIDDLRITKGVARYTANFTPPTAAFPNE